MAEKLQVVASVSIDSTKAKKGIDDLKNALESAKKAQADMVAQFGEGSKEAEEAAKAVNEIEQSYIKMKEASQGSDAPIKSLKQQLKEANNELISATEKFGATSKEAAVAAKKVAELKDSIGDAKTLSDAFNPDAKFKGLANAIQGAAGAFSALQGAQALFGGKSKELEETLVKVNAAMALSQGLNSVLESVDAFKALGSQIKNAALFQQVYAVATKAATAVSAAFGIAVEGTSLAFKVLRGAIITTGIGALVIGIGLLVNKIMEWTDSTKDQEKAEKTLGDAMERNQKILDDELKSIDYVSKARILRAKIAGKTEAEITEIEKNADKDRIEAKRKKFEEDQKIADNAAKNDKISVEKKQELDKASLKSQQEYFDALSESDLKELERQASVADKQREQQKQNNEKSKQAREKNREEEKRLKAVRDAFDLESEKLANQNLLNQISEGFEKQKLVIRQGYNEQIKEVDDLLKKGEITQKESNDRKLLLSQKLNADLLNVEKEGSKKRQQFLEDINKQTEKAIQNARLTAIEEGFTKQQILLEQRYQDEIDAVIKQNDALNEQYKKDKENLDILFKNKQISEEEYNKQSKTLKDNLTTDEAAINKLRLANEQAYQAERDKLIQDNNKKTELDNFNKATKELEDVVNADNLMFSAKKKALDDEQKLLDDARAKGTITEEQYTERSKKLAAARIAVGKAEVENRKTQLQAITGLLNGFADLVGKQTKAGKAAAIAGLIIDQGQRVAEIITSTQAAVAKDVAASPLTGGLPWAALHIAQGALGVATSVKAVKKGISDIKSAGEGGGESSGGGGSLGASDVGAAPAPVPPLPPQATTTALPQEQINQLVGANAAVKAYVVESDVTNGQERITRLNRAARIS